MKSTLKRTLATVFAGAMLATVLVGCTKAEDPKTLVIGGIGPITGEAASYGTSVKEAMELAVEEINAADGVGTNGIKFELNFEDDAHNAETAVQAYNNLLDKNAKVLLGTVTSKPCIAVAEKTKDENMFMLTPSGSAVECIKYPNAFRLCFNDPNQGSASADYISENFKGKKIGVIFNNSDPYSKGINETFQARAKELGLDITESQAFTDKSSTDFSTQIQKLKSAKVEFVFLPIYYQAAAAILKQSNTIGLEATFFGCDGLDGVISQLDKDKAIADGVMLLTPFAADAQDDATQKFVAAYKAKFEGKTPDQFAANAYDSVYTLKAAMEKAEIADTTISVSDLCEKLKTAMTEITVNGVTGEMKWSANGEPTKTAKAMVIENGAYKALD